MEENRCRARSVIGEVEKSVVGKTDILRKVMTAILAGGHVLIEDIPGTGKTTLALSFSHAMGLKVNRVQFTPDVLPADLSGFTIYARRPLHSTRKDFGYQSFSKPSPVKNTEETIRLSNTLSINLLNIAVFLQ